MRKRIAIDLDDTLSYFVEEWLEAYNEVYNDHLTKDKITEWNIAKFTKPDCNSKIYEMLTWDEIFLRAKVRENAVEVTKWLGDYYDLYIVTAYNYQTARAKTEWVIENLPHIDYRRVVFCNDKFIIDADYLIDDKDKNCVEFQGKSLLFGINNPWNDYYKNQLNYNSSLIKVANWNDVFNYFYSISAF